MSLENISQRTKPGKLALVGQQLAYLESGTTGNNNKGDLEKTISENKHAKLAVRLQYLIEDLALLRSADFIDSDQWAKTWEELDDMAHKNRVYIKPRNVKNIGKNEFSYYSFGIQIGHLVHLLCKHSVSESKHAEITCGFLIGLAGEHMTEIDPCTETSENSSHPTDSEEIKSSKILSGPSSDALQTIKSVQHSLITSQESAPSSFEDLASAQALTQIGLDSYGPLRDEVWERAKERNHSFADKLLKSAAKMVQDDERLEMAEDIADFILGDIDALTDKKYGAKRTPVFASEVFTSVCSQANPSKTDVWQQIVENRRDKPGKQTISKLRNDIQGEGTDSRHWNEFPIIKEVSGRYKPTDYGEFLAIITIPEFTGRDSNEYLPQPDNEDLFYFPSREQVLVACYAYAFGHPNETRQEIFDAAYDELTSD